MNRMSKAGTSKFYWGHVSSGDGDACGDARRTNNNVESWHRRLNQIMGGAHLNFWEFVGKGS